MRTFLLVLALSSGIALADQGRVAPPLEVVNGNGPAPLDGQFLAHGPSPRQVTLAAPKDEAQPLKPQAIPVIGHGRRAEIGALPIDARTFQWRRTGDGFVAELAVRSTGAAALRVALASDSFEGMEIRVGDGAAWAGSGPAQVLDRALVQKLREGVIGSLWTPITSGEVQLVQLYVRSDSAPAPVLVENVSHLDFDPHYQIDPQRPRAKLLSCEQNYSCNTNSTIQGAGKAVAKITYSTSDGFTHLCSGSLLNDRGSTGTPWFTTAAHCLINNQSVASSLHFFWYYEDACGSSTLVPNSATTVGAQLLLWDSDIDFNFLKVTGPLPSGLRSLGWDSADVPDSAPVFGVHHPHGAPKMYSTGTKTGDKTVPFSEPGFAFNVFSSIVNWSVGITEPGSSGSPLLTSNGAFRGTLSAGPQNGTCATPIAYYAKFSIAYPRIRGWIDPVTSTTDDWPNAVAQATTAQNPNSALNGVLNSSTDQDWFKYTFSVPGIWIVYTTIPSGATTDTYGRVYQSDGATLVGANDNDPLGKFGSNFLFFLHVVNPTSGYVQVTGANGSTGQYVLNSIFVPDDDHSDFYFLGTPLSPNGSDVGTISSGGDADYFAVDVTAPGTLMAESSGNTDLVGRLYDSSFNLVAENDDISATNLNFRLQAAVSAGKYYLGVFGYDVETSGPYSIRTTFTGTQVSGSVTAKTLGSRATVSPNATLYGGFETANSGPVYILVRGNSLGTLGVTQGFLDAPRVRVYNGQGQDLVMDAGGRPGFNQCQSGSTVANYYQNVRGQAAHARDACVAQTLAPGAYTFSVVPSVAGVNTGGTTSSPSSGEVLFEVTLGGGAGSITKTLGSRATVSSSATHYGGFELASAANVYILVRGNSLGTLGVTQGFLDAPRVRIYNGQGQDMVMDTGGRAGFNTCLTSNSASAPVANYYQSVRGQAAHARDACIAQTLPPGTYTFSVTPSIPGVTTASTQSAPQSGEVLFEVTLGP